MNTKLIAIAIAIAFVFVAGHACASGQNEHAALPMVDVSANAPLVVDCRDEKLPSLGAVAMVLGTNNGSAIYTGRDKVRHYAHRECMRGASSVAFVRDEDVTMPTLALVQKSGR
jgi:hypothetical protein